MKNLLYMFLIHPRYDKILQNFVSDEQSVYSYLKNGVSKTFVECYPPMPSILKPQPIYYLEPFAAPAIETIIGGKE